ncbi:putative isopenicillin N synthase [Helianthus annuus]|nr:putative isopenicillin N synthase [Helianthus annuus]
MTKKMSQNGTSASTQPDYDRKAELRAFDETKTGVKGLVDGGITEVPRIFHLPSPENLNSQQPELTLPTIDLQGLNEDPIRQKEVIGQVKDALES